MAVCVTGDDLDVVGPETPSPSRGSRDLLLLEDAAARWPDCAERFPAWPARRVDRRTIGAGDHHVACLQLASRRPASVNATIPSAR
jgi:hypothetical protein